MTYVAMTHLTSPEAKALAAERPLGLIPTGSVEQHGPHLPLGTDSFIAEALGLRIGTSIAETVVAAPVVPGGLSTHHLAFPGTVTFSEELFGSMLDAYVDAFERMGIRRVAIFSGHGGNLAFLGRYEAGFRSRVSQLQLIAHHDPAGYVEAMFEGARAGDFEPVATDMHAGGIETSQALTAFPSLVRPFDDVVGYTAAEKGWLDKMAANGIDSVSPSGVLGEVAHATAAAGESIFTHIADYLVGWIVESLGYSRAVATATSDASAR